MKWHLQYLTIITMILMVNFTEIVTSNTDNREHNQSTQPNKLSKYLENLNKKKNYPFDLASNMKSIINENENTNSYEDQSQSGSYSYDNRYTSEIVQTNDENKQSLRKYSKKIYNTRDGSHFYYPRTFNDLQEQEWSSKGEEDFSNQNIYNSKRRESTNQNRKHEYSPATSENFYDYAKERYNSYTSQEPFVYSLDDSYYNRNEFKHDSSDYRSNSQVAQSFWPSPIQSIVIQPIDKRDRAVSNNKPKNKVHKIIEAVMGALQD